MVSPIRREKRIVNDRDGRTGLPQFPKPMSRLGSLIQFFSEEDPGRQGVFHRFVFTRTIELVDRLLKGALAVPSENPGSRGSIH